MDSATLASYFNPTETQRIMSLLSRSASMQFELNKYSEQGINVVTRADKEYPHILKSKLKKACPPLFYYTGDISITNRKFIGFVGSRNITEIDAIAAGKAVRTAMSLGYGIVSGGAKGVDSISVQTALDNKGYAIEYVSDSLINKIRKKDKIQAIRDKKLVIISASIPNAGFNVGAAMGRNKFIYTQSEATIVVRSDFNKGGTWSGANEALTKGYCSVLCLNNNTYKGNQEIVKKGAVGIDETWDGGIPVREKEPELLTLFSPDMM